METPEKKSLARSRRDDTDFVSPAIRFGTDGWRAIIGEGFTVENLARVVGAAAQVFKEDNPGAGTEKAPTLLVGYDCRENAGAYAALAAALLASEGFKVRLSHSYCPTPTLCWSVAHDPAAVGGLILTSSHNPAEYLGVKLRMQDGGASPKSFSDRVEQALAVELPSTLDEALAFANAVMQAECHPEHTECCPEHSASQQEHTACRPELVSGPHLACPPHLEFADFMQPYLARLASWVDRKVIAAAKLRVVVDPMFGAGRGYLAELLRSLGVEVDEINAAADSTFAGLHPEPIAPWVNGGLARVAELGYDALFITDGDADRLGAGTREGSFVTPHKILALICALLVEDKGKTGRVVRTLSGSNLIKRQCERLGLELTTTPVGFKWIYEEMLKGDVMLGGEESGGIGIPDHVRERDGLLMALLLTELMATKKKDLGTLVDELHQTLGSLEYARLDLTLTEEQKETFLKKTHERQFDAPMIQEQFEPLGEHVAQIDYRDGIRFEFASDAWLLARPSGTEPLVRVYAEAATTQQVEQLLALGAALVKGE